VQVGRQLLDHDPDAVRIVVEVLDVAAGAKRLPCARDDDASHGAVLIGLERGAEEIAGQRQVQGIVGLGTIHCDRGDGVLDLVADGVVMWLSLVGLTAVADAVQRAG
jgi:hypothetical protein